MRWLFVLALGACAPAGTPHRFASPMLGMASLPPPALPGHPKPPDLANRDPLPHDDSASHDAADAIAHTRAARDREQLPAPHRAGDMATRIRHLSDLRGLVGRRDTRDPIVATLAWAAELGLHTEATTGAELVAWAEREHRLSQPIDPIAAGDVLVFSRTEGEAFDRIGIVVTRDRVVEFVYLAGGVVRRGFLDPVRTRLRRDATGAIVNTSIRHGKRSPPAGTRYLAGELLVGVIKLR
jgi:hypothetical protein